MTTRIVLKRNWSRAKCSTLFFRLENIGREMRGSFVLDVLHVSRCNNIQDGTMRVRMIFQTEGLVYNLYQHS